jgi:hypothetical protein
VQQKQHQHPNGIEQQQQQKQQPLQDPQPAKEDTGGYQLQHPMLQMLNMCTKPALG